MSDNSSFEPLGATQNEAVTATFETISLAGKLPDKDGAVRLLVIGTQTVFVRLDGTTPTTSNGIPLRPDQPESFKMPVGQVDIKHIASATGSTLYVTPGRGR
ncbi:MAG TPA: hypothetical protein VFS41_11995 [Edaphobacter sp.]|nr:hypothetical protein [Edaphobacter sp.]